MKTLLLALSLFPVLASAQMRGGCTKLEAQVIGKVRETQITTLADGTQVCKFRMNVGDWFLESVVCPLAQDAVEDALITDNECLTKVGEKVSGVIVNDVEKETFHLDR